jgi:hypothetical protein
MNPRALVVASNLVEHGLHLRRGCDHSNLHDWIEDVVKERTSYLSSRARFDELTAANPPANTAGQEMAFEYGRAAYELGVQVGLRMRKVDDRE